MEKNGTHRLPDRIAKMNVLILEPDLGQSVAIAKYLRKYTGNSCIIGCRQKAKTNRLKWLNGSKYYNKYIVREINRPLLDEYPVIIPTGGRSTLAFRGLCPSFRLGEVEFRKENLVVSDKNYMHKLCRELNVPIPYTYHFGEKVESFPVFYKSDHETSSLGKLRGIVRSQEDLDKLPQRGILVQEYIPTPSTFGVGFIAQEGKLLTHFMHEELLSYPKEGGSGVVLKKTDDTRLLQYTSKLIEKLQYHGWGLAEFKYCKRRDDYVFMEINAKFWASFEFTLLANPLFGKLLFGLDYPAKSSSHIVYIHRLLMSNPINWLKYLPQIISGHRTLSGGWRKAVSSAIQGIVGLFKH
jgi:hypothetical protein